jgi:HEPN domain-containing protein
MRENPEHEGKRWLAQAKADLKWARHLAEQGGWHLACFLSQQVTEKALKAFLYAQGEEIVLGHSVARLIESAVEYKPDLRNTAKKWTILDGYYVPTRYPNGLPDGIPAEVYTKEAAFEAVSFAQEAVEYFDRLIEQ